MGTMFKQLWAALTMFFLMLETLSRAAGKGATALDHLGTWCEESAGSFADQARIDREKQRAILQSGLDNTNKAISNGSPLPAITGSAN